MKTKICTKCKEKKPISEFWKDKKNKDGLFNFCKQCKREYGRRWQSNNSEYIREYKKEWRVKNPEYMKKYQKNNPIKNWCRQTINNHKTKGFEVLFTSSELFLIAKETKICPICDDLLDWEYGTGLNRNSPTLDRKDNRNILTLYSTWIICHKCNTTKLDRTIKELYDWCKNFINQYEINYKIIKGMEEE